MVDSEVKLQGKGPPKPLWIMLTNGQVVSIIHLSAANTSLVGPRKNVTLKTVNQGKRPPEHQPYLPGYTYPDKYRRDHHHQERLGHF